MPKQQLNPALDPECQAIYRDLEALAARAVAMRGRYDRENVAVGKWWGVARNLTCALDAMRDELGIEEVYADKTPAEVLAERDAYERACG